MKKEINPEDFASCPLPISSHDTIQLAHGSGGRMMNDLVQKLFLWAFDNSELNRQDDNAVIEIDGNRFTFTTDSFVVDPIFFPQSDIGELAVNGTINDISIGGAVPLYLSVGLIIEEGFPLEDLRKIVVSIKNAAEKADVSVVTGDTKVVNKGKGDKIFINTSGIGVIKHNYKIGPEYIKPSDMIIINGAIAEHGIAVLSKREGLSFETSITSDTAPLNDLIAKIIETGGDSVHAMRDPTRGGVAATLNEFAASSNVGIRIQENQIPIKEPVRGACEILGFDPLYVANEGKLVVVIGKEKAGATLNAMRAHPLGKDAAIIGEVVSENPGMVSMQTGIGGWRIVDMPVGEQLPRIC
ncbi:MAG: hydrogenase expression/formation protein HypE [Candidatus Zixiibacteriota bacterium]|nr:MAG: hydrogenase expression/formation protein HypE [candidate division Zixibacteria bacterium]